MSLIIFDLEALYQRVFRGKPYRVDGENEYKDVDTIFANGGNGVIKEKYLDKDIWLPIRFTGLDKSKFEDGELYLPYATIKIGANKTIVKTPLAERQGTVKELFSINDYQISIKGFMIDDEGKLWPETEITNFRDLWKLGESMEIDNVLTNIFLEEERRVVIEYFDMVPEAGKINYMPFSMRIESDSVFTLEVE